LRKLALTAGGSLPPDIRYLLAPDQSHAAQAGLAFAATSKEGTLMLRTIVSVGAFALAVTFAQPAAAQRIKAGVLTCDVSGGFGFIIGSSKQVFCNFSPDQPGPPEAYVGSISKFGLDIGVTSGGVMIWAVFTGTGGYGPGFLAGDYIGATAEATVAAGLGANVLIGGSSRTIALQPLSVSGQVGLNVAIGVAELRLQPGVNEPAPRPPGTR
jgi:Protein of unknown function (DUF992)